MIFDGDCGFCRYWVGRWRHVTGDRVDYAPSKKVAERFPEIPSTAFQNAVQLVEPDGNVSSGADAVFRALEHAPEKIWWLGLLRALPGFEPAVDVFYRQVAGHRVFFSWLTRVFLGHDPTAPSYLVARWLFLRLIGIVYLVAFSSLFTQLKGLIGSQGIVPAAEFLKMVGQSIGIERYWLCPTVFWLNSSDGFLTGACIAGMFLASLVIAGFFEGLSLFLLWALYLSFITVGSPFLNFQWDCLLLQAGFLSIFLIHPGKIRGFGPETRAIRWTRWLLLWLLFCLMFESGVVKLTSGDDSWSNFTALTYHYETQPLPLWTSWYLNQSPLWFEKLSVAVMFFIELAVPFSIFGPRNIRRAGCGLLIFLQLFIAATGNYCFFNLLTISLCLLLLDDAVWPLWLRNWVSRRAAATRGEEAHAMPWIVGTTGCLTLYFSSIQLLGAFGRQMEFPGPLEKFNAIMEGSFRTFNSYGLFRVMTKTRNEIVIEGSRDGETWLPYEFYWKPGDVNRRPGLVAPFQPRLDWQMWFAALGNYRQNPWLISFMTRLLQGVPDVLPLVERNPFPAVPPRYIRAVIYTYHFTRSGDSGKAWWKRELLGLYTPPFSLSEGATQGR